MFQKNGKRSSRKLKNVSSSCQEKASLQVSHKIHFPQQQQPS